MSGYPVITINTRDPDPEMAINAFLWCLHRARDLGFVPPTEHCLAEHLFRKDAKVIFYSSSSGVTSIVMDEASLNNLDEDDTFEFITNMLQRQAQRRREKRNAASGIEARSDETALAELSRRREPGSAGGRPMIITTDLKAIAMLERDDV